VQQMHQKPKFTSDRRASAMQALAPVFFYFFAAGIATVMLGPLLPALMLRWHLADAQAGTLFAAGFLGQICGAWFATRRLRASVIYGALLTAAGCVAIAHANFGGAHVALFFIGLGLGAGLAAGNVIAGTIAPSSRASLLAILNVAWGLGAIACPVLVHLSIARDVSHFFYWTAACLAISAAVCIRIPHSMQPNGRSYDSTENALDTKSHLTRLPLSPLSLLAFASAMFLYIGVENSLGGWLPSYAIRTNPTLQAASISFGFWSAELVGRLLAAVLMTPRTERSVYRICLALLIITGALICVVARLSPFSMVILTILSGLALAPIYPLIVSFMLARTGNHLRLGPLFASASLGGVMLPWLTGVFSTALHGLRAGLVVPATGAVGLLILSAVITSNSAAKT
jgi:MFS transporter, FHS family, glucose/mannose:H+ symporter